MREGLCTVSAEAVGLSLKGNPGGTGLQLGQMFQCRQGPAGSSGSCAMPWSKR
jgi:hypothetical protein